MEINKKLCDLLSTDKRFPEMVHRGFQERWHELENVSLKIRQQRRNVDHRVFQRTGLMGVVSCRTKRESISKVGTNGCLETYLESSILTTYYHTLVQQPRYV